MSFKMFDSLKIEFKFYPDLFYTGYINLIKYISNLYQNKIRARQKSYQLYHMSYQNKVYILGFQIQGFAFRTFNYYNYALTQIITFFVFLIIAPTFMRCSGN